MVKTIPEAGVIRSLRFVFPALTGTFFLMLALTLLIPPDPELSPAVRAMAAMPASGVENPVTAVLLNFRAFDTLLEMGVLLLAVIGVWSLRIAPETTTPLPVDPILLTLTWTLLPLMVLIAAYLVWIGARDPGGAFQGGAILGAAGVLLLLTGRRLSEICPPGLFRLLLALGLTIFLLIGLGPLPASGLFLAYPPDMASSLILLIESAAAISIGLALTALMAGGRPEDAEPQNIKQGLKLDACAKTEFHSKRPKSKEKDSFRQQQ
jgi:multisubunit Na+/H+ antiporter MnhB subunit